ncbi:MazG nucleotide pyrophosphohydrolase [Gammaproteobacteria bacterium]
MTFKEYSIAASKTACYPNDVALAYLVMGLAGEAGELCNKYKKVLRDADGGLIEENAQAMLCESGDVLWYLARLCDELGSSLETVAKENVVKLASRKERGKIKGSGDTR